MLALLVVLAGSALRGTNIIGHGFTDDRQAARESVMVNGANEIVLRARLTAMQFWVENSQERVETVFSRVIDLRNLKSEMAAFMTNDQRSAEINRLGSLIDDYELAFQQSVELQS